MAWRDTIRAGANQYLAHGEVIQAVFAAKRPTSAYNDRVVVATDQRFVLLSLNFWGRPNGFLEEAQRSVKLGPAKGSLLYSLPVFVNHGLKVSRRFYGDVADADRAAGLD